MQKEARAHLLRERLRQLFPVSSAPLPMRVLQRYDTAPEMARAANPSTGRRPKKGSTKAMIVEVLGKHGPQHKKFLKARLAEAGLEIADATLNSALSKSGGIFTSDGNGKWRLAT